MMEPSSAIVVSFPITKGLRFPHVMRPSCVSELPISVDQCVGEFPRWTIKVEQISEDDERLKQTYWIGAHVNSSVSWPTKPHVAHLDDVSLFILPHKDDWMPCVFSRYGPQTEDQVREQILRFLSVWSWTEGYGIRVENWTQGSHMFRSKNNYPFRTIMDFPLEFDYWPLDANRETRVALALYREGMSLRHAPYSFLSFFKIVNLLASNNNSQRKLIATWLPGLEEQQAKKRLEELGNFPNGMPVQDYIVQSGRHAVAHASVTKGNTVDPDDPTHEIRLQRDLPIMREVARLLIVNKFGVPTKQDVWRSKTHYVQGAIWYLGKTDYCRILSGETLGRRSVNLPKCVDLKNKSKAQFSELRCLFLKVEMVDEAVIWLTVSSDDRMLKLYLSLDLNKGRLHFEPLIQHECRDDGSSRAAVRTAQYLQFWAEVVGNGRVQLIEHGTERVIAEADAYLPSNWMLNHEGSKADIEHWQRKAAERANSKATNTQ